MQTGAIKKGVCSLPLPFSHLLIPESRCKRVLPLTKYFSCCRLSPLFHSHAQSRSRLNPLSHGPEVRTEWTKACGRGCPASPKVAASIFMPRCQPLHFGDLDTMGSMAQGSPKPFCRYLHTCGGTLRFQRLSLAPGLLLVPILLLS